MSSTISRMLFTTDLSVNSTYALHQAIGLARATEARMHILHVAEPMSEDARITLRLFIQDEKARESALQTRKQAIEQELADRQERFWSALPEDSQSIRQQVDEVEVVEGHPAEVILRRAKELDSDLIVLGAHSHGFSQTFLGSTAKRVLRRATIPTLVVPYRSDRD
ncbi:universal stress protein [Granulosicoccus sp. 3-233]|uniref:universal stress protein n=1 Tax=Granulosicoccus sp. 3-233 TaxID=3417969 RepID=UPI003D3386BA